MTNAYNRPTAKDEQEKVQLTQNKS